MSECAMAIKCNVKVLLAQRNVERAKAGERAISVHQLAEATKLTESALLKFVNNRSTRVDFDTIDKLMAFFNTNDLNDILIRVPESSYQK